MHYCTFYNSTLLVINTVSPQVQINWKSNFAFSVTGANVNAKDHGLLTPLHRAAASRNEVCSHFKTQGEKDFSEDLTNRLWCLISVFFEFCLYPQRAVELLLKHRAEVNARDKFRHTPLHMAAAKWATGCALALIPHVCSLDVADRYGRTPLHHAAHSGHGEVNCKVDGIYQSSPPDLFQFSKLILCL